MRDDPYNPTPPEQIEKDKAEAQYDKERIAADKLKKSNETVAARTPLRRTFLGDLKNLASDAGKSLRQTQDEVGTAFYNFRKDPSEPKMLTRAGETKIAEELRKSRR